MTQIVDLRGPCGRLAGRLDTTLRVIQRKCPECSREMGQTVYHWFDAQTGEAVEAEPFGEEQGQGLLPIANTMRVT